MRVTMKTIYYGYFNYEDDEQWGEMDAFFKASSKLSLITWWDNNDANYRSEYMSPLFKHVGVEIKTLPREKRKEAIKLLKKEIS